jgi:hypothetical protein
MMESKVGRQPIQIVEIDETVCSLSYGNSPCEAEIGVTGTRKCFNTYGTCQDKPNFDPTTRTLKFCKPFDNNDGQYANLIPSIQSVTTLPTKLNIGGADFNQGPLGRRGSVTVVFNDHPYSDILTDPYVTEREYNPLQQGTFWSKWNARNPFYNGSTLRIREGYIGETLEDMQTRSYIIEKVQGANSQGRVQIVAKDILKLADDRRVQAPVANTGILNVELLNTTTTTFTLQGSLLSEYSSSGTVRIGNECITYSNVTENEGILTFTITARGTDGTLPQTHSVNTSVQECLRITETLCWDVIYTLLTDYAGVDPIFIDKDEWDIEGNFWLPQFTISALITEPTGVNQLIGEICEQCLVNIWWDEREQLIKMKAVRAPVEIAPDIDDNKNIIAGSFSTQTKETERITQLWIYIQQRDPTKNVDDTSNYKTVNIRVDANAESEFEYNDTRVRKIFARWLETNAQSIVLGARVLDRYRTIPEVISVSLDAKDRVLWTGDIVNILHRTITDDTGLIRPKLYQIISAQEVFNGHLVQYEMQNFPIAGFRFGFYMENDAPDYADATPEEIATGGFYANENGKIPDDNSFGYEYQ